MRSWTAVVMLVSSLSACASAQSAAAKDPLRCERDPKCAKHERAFDCSTQCADDSACVERCSQVQEQTGTSSPR